MTIEWTERDTTTHQDHVIAHVIGATVLGYLIHEEALHALLDIGFIWKIFVDGEMGLLPHPVAVGELDIGKEERVTIQADIEILLREGSTSDGLKQLTPAPVNCLIEDVKFYESGDERRLLIRGEEELLTIETSVDSGRIEVK